MVFKHLQDLFDPKDFAIGFSQSFLVYFYVATECILENIAMALGARRLLILTKPSSGIQLITISEILYWLVNMTLCFQFCNSFLTHLSPANSSHS
jgi:hypothetical protein